MKTQLIAACAAVAALSGCYMSAAPDPAAGLGPRARVYAPVLEEVIGGLHLDRDGLWAFSTENKTRASSYDVGQIVAFGDLDETKRHLFAVVEVRPWGLKLQRLDAETVAPNARGSLIPLTRPDLQTAKRWRFCSGSGNPAASECLETAAPGTRWYVYPLADDGRLLLGDDNRRANQPRTAMPVALTAIIAVGSLGTDVHQAELPTQWLAVPGPTLGRPTVPRIVVAEACSGVVAGARDFDAQWFVRPGPFGDHPVEVTSAAFAEGADAFVSCADGKVSLSAPGLYRRRVDVPGQGVSAPPFLAAKPVDLAGLSPEETRLATRLAAAVSTGDFTTADFYADRLARLSSAPAVDKLLLLAMTALAHGGRPEAAVLLGLRAGAHEWNIETSGPWIWGMAAAESALGASKQAIVRAQSLSEVLDRGGDDLLRAWITYFWSLEQLEKRESVGEALEMLEAHPLFAFAARVEFARRRDASKLADLAAELEARELVGLARAFGGGDVALPCPAGGCALDVYGRLWAGGLVDPQLASRVGYSSLRPGFEHDPTDDDDEPMAALLETVARYPFAKPEDQQAAVDAAARAATRWVSGSCFPADATAREALERLRRVGIDAALRMTDWQTEPLDATMAWLAIRGTPAACESVESLVERATQLAAVAGPTTVPADLLTLWVERANGEALQSVLALASEHVSEHERGQRCVDWNLALAVDAVRAGRFGDAGRFVDATSACRVDDRAEIDLVAAYLGFQRSGSVSADFDAAIRRRLALIVHTVPENPDACLGAGQLEYHLLPQISAPIADLVRRLPAQPADDDETLGVVTAARQLVHAREALAAVTTHLDAGRPVDAARQLGFARERFEALGHTVGLARVRWIDKTLFDNRAAAAATGDTTALAAVFRPRKRNQTFTAFASDPESPATIRLAWAASTGDEPLIRSLVETTAPAQLTAFCAVPDTAPPGTVLDVGDDGRLQRVTD